MTQKKEFYSADEAATLLNVAKGTLYSYVSRGMLRSEEGANKTRARRYLALDVDALIERKQRRKDPERVAKSALNWGAPVLESKLTLITDERLFYRGRDAIRLATEQTFEEVASLLWQDMLAAKWGSVTTRIETQKFIKQHLEVLIRADAGSGTRLKPLEAFQVVLPAFGAADLAAYLLEKEATIQSARQILQLMALLAANLSKGGFSEPGVPEEYSIAEMLQTIWAPNSPQSKTLIDAALILCADHELNVSSFTVRCVASAGSSPYAAVNAGLSALQGHRHGGQSELVERLFDEIELAIQNDMANETETKVTSCTQSVIAARLKRGEKIPGFGHPLYPTGDPRCKTLLEKAYPYGYNVAKQNEKIVYISKAIVEVVSKHVGKAPNLDFGLTVLSKVLGLPVGSPLVIFALGRTAGWIGHYLEQIETEQLIRPRATYVGERP